MSKVKINNSIIVDGKFTIEVFADKSNKPITIYKRGIFETDKYIEEISSLENERYFINGIDVYKETYGSEDDIISYEFSFSNMQNLIKGKDGMVVK